jgi:hypothetical protein
MAYRISGPVYLLLLGAALTISCGGGDPQNSGGGGSGGESAGGGGASGICDGDEDCTGGFNLICAGTDDGMCGAITKKCIEYPATCGEGTYSTVCGCDGKSHAIGPCPGDLPFQIDTRPGSCPAAAGTFWCGDGACTIGGQYCVEGNMSVDCVELPPDCLDAQATCACLEAAGMTACGCTEEPGGGLRVNGCGL